MRTSIMKPTRLTRLERHEQTVERLVHSGRSVFLDKGFAAASIEDIAELAGYTRGAFYSNYRSKSDLFLELLRRDFEEIQARLRNPFGGAKTREELGARLLVYYSSFSHDGNCFLLWIEARLLAARDARFRSQFEALRRAKQDQLSAVIHEFSLRGDIQLAFSAETLAYELISLLEGMQFWRTGDPEKKRPEGIESITADLLAQIVFGRATTTISDIKS